MGEMKWKELDGLLADDPSLAEKITYEQYENREAAPANSDEPFESAYNNYMLFMQSMN